MSHLHDCPLGAWERDFDAWCKMEHGSEASSAEVARLLDELRRINQLVEVKARMAIVSAIAVLQRSDEAPK